MTRIELTMKQGNVATLILPMTVGTWVNRRKVEIEVLVELREAKDGTAQLVVTGPSEGDRPRDAS